MIAAPLALVAAALGAALDPCAAVPGGEADPALAATYREIADAERAAGRAEPAIAAYRAAAERDARDARSRAALAALCAERRRERALADGLALLRQGAPARAVPLLEEARAGGDPAASLLEGICLYELHDDARAADRLREAEEDPPSRASARLFLGLLALRDGRGAEGARLLDAASAADARLAPVAAPVAAGAGRDGRVVLSLQAESAWDSNVALTPAGAPDPAGASDAMAALTAGLRVAPLGDAGPYAFGSAGLRQQLRLEAYDLRLLGGGAGWRLGRGPRSLSAEYGYDRVDLGGAPYLRAHRLQAAARAEVARAATVGVAYRARLEAYAPSGYADLSGLRQEGEAEASLTLGRRWSLTAGWRVERDGVRDPSLSWWEHGPRASARLLLRPTVRAGVEAAAAWRGYDAPDPVLQVRRSDAYLDAGLSLEVDLGAHVTLRLAAVARHAGSNVPDFAYARVVPSGALGYTVGWL